MCGISGIIAFTERGKPYLDRISEANRTLARRGPDNEGFFRDEYVALGHRRLSIIDVSAAANQPMSDEQGRYVLVFNGEFFNFREHRNALIAAGEQFHTASDTEVLLRLYMREGPSCLSKVNGFFALAIYDNLEQTLFLARDRMGIKPLFYQCDRDKIIFGSELKSLLAAGIPRVPDRISMMQYFQLNYIPGPYTVFEGVRKLRPGHFMVLQVGKETGVPVEQRFYEIPHPLPGGFPPVPDYERASSTLRELLAASVERRLISDVPLGAFLSGGIDSSVIVALASRFTKHLNTFSIGFTDEPMYDETRYAGMVADRYQTNHTVFRLTTDDLLEHVTSVLDYLDEPFADSSALAVNILSMHTRKKVTVALSGDGADELFAGYNKHRAEWMVHNRPLFTGGMRTLAPLLRPFNGARNAPLANRIRQIRRFSEGVSMDAADRYWRWCSYMGEEALDELVALPFDRDAYKARKHALLEPLGAGRSMNDVLYMDMHQVLVNDMLVKVDLMSMRNSLEVRVPFLDYTVVDYVFSLPDRYKMDKYNTKKILRDTFRSDLPAELYNRPKHGFEVPLLKWFRTSLKSMITDDLLDDSFVESQGVFDPAAIRNLKQQLFSSHPGEIEARMWGLIVFQHWWKKYMSVPVAYA